MSIMQSFRQILLVVVFLLALILGPVLFAGYADLSSLSLAASAHDRAFYAESAARRLPWAVEFYEVAGSAALDDGAYVDAIRLLLLARSKAALTSGGQFKLGKAYFLLGAQAKALTEWQTLPNGDPATVSASPYLADAYHAQARFKDEERVLRQWLALDPQSADVHYRLGILLFADASPDAIALFEFVSANSPELKPAADGLRVALKTALADPNPLTYCGQTLAAMGEWTLALQTLTRATDADANDALAWAWLAETRQQLKMGDALAALQRAKKLSPASAQIHAMFALYWQRQGDWQSSYVEFNQAARLEPQNAIWQISLGDVYVHLGNLITALAYYEKATSLAPNDAQTWRALAIFSIENGSNLDGAARNAALRAYALEPENVQNLDVLGRALMAFQEYDAAETFLLRAVDAAPRAGGPAFHLAFLYLQTGKSALAQKYFHLAQTLDPNGLIGDQATRLLARYFP